MPEETTVTAADIARLAGVGRTAVSNWRRRYADFPRPAGGTPASPLFALAEVEAWLRGQGKVAEVPVAERAWQELRALAGDDLRLAATLADAAELLARRPANVPPALGELAAALGPADAFEVLLCRFQELQGRRAATPPDLAELMAALAGGARTVLDPACGTGELLLAARDHGAARLLGQDLSAGSARLAAARLLLGGADAVIRAGDSLLADGFAGVAADAVLCDPPFHERSWGHERLAADPRWTYGLPPRLEPELAWVQHILAHLAPDGLAVVLMPAAAAARRPGRRIRAQLLRRGALRGVLGLSAAHHLWLLRQPGGGAPPGTVLMAAAADPAAAAAAWQRFCADPGHDEPGVSRGVPVIDLLDEEVDLTPARRLSAPSPEHTAERFARTRDDLAAAAAGLRALIPDLPPAAARPAGTAAAGPVTVPVAELARTGQLAVYHAPARGDVPPGEHAVLTVEDVIADRPASGRGAPDERWIALRARDVIVAIAPRGGLVARVAAGDGDILGPGLTLLRADPGRLDPWFLAGTLGSPASAPAPAGQSGSSGRADIRQARIPALPLAQQRRYGGAFRQAADLRAALRAAAADAGRLAALLADGVHAGTLDPPGEEAALP